MISTPTLVHEGLPELLVMERAPGLHVSAIIRDLCVRLGHFADEDIPTDRTRLEMGSAFEDMLAASLAARHARSHNGAVRYVQPGEMCVDDIHGNMDLLDTEDFAVEEIKLTWMSSRHDPESPKYWRYWVQLQAYCYMIETTLGRLHVCHINGDYRGSGPLYRVWERRFTEQELDENWRMLRSHGERLRGR